MSMNVFSKLKAYLMYRNAVIKANDAHRKDGQRYYVMMGASGEKNLLIMDRVNFRQLKHKGYITPKAFVSDLLRECFYCTPYKNGYGELSNEVIEYKKQQFYKWFES